MQLLFRSLVRFGAGDCEAFSKDQFAIRDGLSVDDRLHGTGKTEGHTLGHAVGSARAGDEVVCPSGVSFPRTLVPQRPVRPEPNQTRSVRRLHRLCRISSPGGVMLTLRPVFRPSQAWHARQQGSHKGNCGNTGATQHITPPSPCTETGSIVPFGEQENTRWLPRGRSQQTYGLGLWSGTRLRRSLAAATLGNAGLFAVGNTRCSARDRPRRLQRPVRGVHRNTAAHRAALPCQTWDLLAIIQ
jgi:hypothetical protein